MSFRPKIITTHAKSLFQIVNNWNNYISESDSLLSLIKKEEEALKLEIEIKRELEKKQIIPIYTSTESKELKSSLISESLFEFIEKLEKNVEKALNEKNGNQEKFDIDKIFSKNAKQNQNLVTFDVISIELNYLTSFIKYSKELESFYRNPTVSEKKKLKVILDLFPGLSKIMSSFLTFLTESNNLGLIPQITEEYDELLSKLRSFTKIKLITAGILRENFGFRLLDILKKVTKSKRILLELSYDPKLLGGLVLEYNSTSTDASILKEFSPFFNEI
jgi:ATP synthase F1 delta subunit